jgi:4-aminobutyrate aminotransferase
VEALLRRETVAAVIAEPIQGNGGILVPPENFWPDLRRLCTRYGTLLIADEIQTAWNRTGRWFATGRWQVTPDIVTVAKALGNGFPIAAFLTTDALADSYRRPAGCTFGGNLVSCRAALATLRYHQEHRLGERSAELGARLIRSLERLHGGCAGVAEVRGRGLMIGVELLDPAGNPDAARTDSVLEAMKDRGYLIGKSGPGRNVLTLMPPLVIDGETLDGLAEELRRALTETA